MTDKKRNSLWMKVITEGQMSETFLNSMFLALSGGFQDAYTYNTRGEVFSNAQTGNVVLMSQHFMSGQWMEALQYVIPLIAFACGVFLADWMQGKYKYASKIHWRQGILVMEIGILLLVGFIPTHFNMLATCLVSFSCAMQVQTFRKVNGFPYASTMCIGNIRSGTAAFSLYLREGSKKDRNRALCYLGIIVCFAVGAGIGGILSLKYGIRVIWVSSGFLSISFLLMFFEKINCE